MKLNISDTATATYDRKKAILLYFRGDETIAVEHRVIHVPAIDDEPAYDKLGPGKFVTKSVLQRLLDLFSHAPLSYVPQNVVAFSSRAIAWYEPASIRSMYFSPTTDSAVGAFDGKAVPQPPLLFVAKPNALSVFALAEDVRPTLDTELAKAPYFNIFDTHNVCLGSMKLPKAVEPSKTAEWTSSFFASEFTHLSGGVRWAFDGTYAEMLTAAIERGSFPASWLAPTGHTIRSAICGK